MLPAFISASEASFANLIWHIEVVKLVRAARILEQGPHSRAAIQSIGGEVEHDRKPVAE